MTYEKAGTATDGARARTARIALELRNEILRRRVNTCFLRADFDVVAVDADVSVIWLDRAAIDGGLRLPSAGAVVAVVAADLHDHDLRRLVAAGVQGLVPEADLDVALVPSIEAVLADQLAIPRRLGSSLEPPALTTKEKQALALVVLGLSNAEMADTLHVTLSTVKSHLRSAFRKLGVRTRSQATAVILDPVRGHGLGILGISQDSEPA